MPAERFYLDGDLNTAVTLSGAEFHHLAHVMKISPGDEVELINGRGALAKAKLLSTTKQSATLQILTVSQTPVPLPRIILAIPLMRPSKLELIIEKCTELGADAFLFYPAHYSDKEALSPHQLERLHYIAISATKQCGRLDLPAITILNRFEDLFTTNATYLFGDTRPNAKKIAPHEKVVFITGPERGFSEKEVKLLDQKATGVSLHKNTLRAETAPIAAICLLLDVNR